MLKKIIILMPSMYIGGAERSLLGLLNALDYTKYEVNLLLFRHQGDFFLLLPENVNILPYDSRFDVFEIPIIQQLISNKWRFGIARLCAKFEQALYRFFKCKRNNVWMAQQYMHKYITPLLPEIKEEYDLAINFLGIPSILNKKIKACTKATWIHTDYDQLVVNERMDLEEFNQVQYIVNVSDECKKVFNKHYPQLVDKSIVIENILSSRFIKEQSEMECVEAWMPVVDNRINILSIGRFGYAKNFDSIPAIARVLLSKGFTFRWYIIGYGNDELLIKQNIEDVFVQDYVILLGKKVNPYPYIKACDLYVQPSRFEGKAVTVREAQILGKPVIITNYETARSQVNTGVDGLIVPMDISGCAEGIAGLILNHRLREQLSDYCSRHEFGNETETAEIGKMIE